MESIVSKHLYENKLEFASKNFELQGKMQFEFEKVLVEREAREQEYPYNKILKTPSAELNTEQIIKKYEIMIK